MSDEELRAALARGERLSVENVSFASRRTLATARPTASENR